MARNNYWKSCRLYFIQNDAFTEERHHIVISYAPSVEEQFILLIIMVVHIEHTSWLDDVRMNWPATSMFFGDNSVEHTWDATSSNAVMCCLFIENVVVEIQEYSSVFQLPNILSLL